jgi:hypothetical protein
MEPVLKTTENDIKPVRNVKRKRTKQATDAGNAVPIPPKTRLVNFDGVKAHLCWTIKNLESGLLDPKVGNALVGALNALAGVLSDQDLEQRVNELEAKQNGKS